MIVIPLLLTVAVVLLAVLRDTYPGLFAQRKPNTIDKEAVEIGLRRRPGEADDSLLWRIDERRRGWPYGKRQIQHEAATPDESEDP